MTYATLRPPVAPEPSMTPVPHDVVERRQETVDTVTLTLAASGDSLPAWGPGQFTMVHAFGIGEIPVSISGGQAGIIRHTVRAVGAVSRAICEAPVGSTIGLRGPFGRGWPAPPVDADVVVMAGGIGLAPLRPVIIDALRSRVRLSVLIGARTPADLIFTDEYEAWRAEGAMVLVTVDRAEAGWPGDVGVVTTLLGSADFTPRDTTAYVCGPEVMMRLASRALVDRGIRPDRVNVSLERNMQCGVALCGHCQLGPVLICRDGPVVGFDTAEPLFAIKEL
jgi:anaerobic sulfite reductase subunit B